MPLWDAFREPVARANREARSTPRSSSFPSFGITAAACYAAVHLCRCRRGFQM